MDPWGIHDPLCFTQHLPAGACPSCHEYSMVRRDERLKMLKELGVISEDDSNM